MTEMTKPITWNKRKYLLDLPPEKPVRVYSLQHPDAITVAKERGYLSGDHNFAFDEEERTNNIGFYRAYQWMKNQMNERITGFTGDLPVWAWLKRPSAKTHPSSIGPTIRITAQVPRKRILLSDFDFFHCVLGNTACALNEEEWDRTMSSTEIEESWQRIFDLYPRPNHIAKWCGQPKYVQACIDRIYWDEIESLRPMPKRRSK